MPTCVSESGSINATITPFVTGDGYDYANAAYANGQFVAHFDIVCNTKQIRIIANNNSATRTLFVDISQNSIITTDTISPNTSYDQTYSVDNNDYVEVYTNFGAGSVAANTFTGSVEIVQSQSSTPSPTPSSSPTPTPTASPMASPVNTHTPLPTAAAGYLWGAGYNLEGPVGDNTTVTRSYPVQNIAQSSNYSQITAGDSSSMSIKKDASLWVWGSGNSGGLALNNTVKKSSPVQTISGGNDWDFISDGQYHALAIKTNGTLWGWGRADFGQLGINSLENRSSPVQIGTATNWLLCSAGYIHSAAIKKDGTL